MKDALMNDFPELESATRILKLRNILAPADLYNVGKLIFQSRPPIMMVMMILNASDIPFTQTYLVFSIEHN